MEIMSNSSRLNDSEGQAASSNYNFRISQDLNLGSGTNSRIGKSEADIGLLVACKVQLSSEVIRWKTESLRLQKERDSIQQRNQDLDQTVSKLASRTQELEAKLMQAEAENGQLKSRSVAIDVEKAALVNKLSQNFNKYHSFPWSDVSSKLTCSRAEQRKVPDVLQDDWREVSQKMLQQMKLEMKELQEMSSRFCSQEGDVSVSQPEAAGVEEGKDDIEEGISSLQTETKSLKCHLLKQRQKLQHLLSSFSSAGLQKGVSNITLGHLDITTPSVENSESKPKPSCSRPNRLSDENYRHYFTKQLGTSCDLGKISKEMQHILKNQETSSVHDIPPDNRQKFKSPISNLPEKQVAEEPRCSEARVCPICQLTFDVAISQEDFEQHVVNHLETESASLLDQYVVI